MKRLYSLISVFAAIVILFSGCTLANKDVKQNSSALFESETQSDGKYIFSDSEESDITVNKANSASKESESKEQEESETTVKPTASKETEKAEERTSEASAETEPSAFAQSTKTDDESEMVWIPNSGAKYHKSASCSGMKNPSHVLLSTAKERGYTPCKKCYK